LARLYPEAVFLIWNRTGAHAEQLAGELTDRGITAEPIGTLSEAVVAADLVVTTTAATAPLVRDIWVRPGTHINAMGADTRGKQELDPALLRRAYVVVDSLAQATAIGELQHVPESIDGDYPSLAEVVSGRRPGRTTPEQVTVFDSTGVTFQDLAVAELAVRRALEQGAGIRVTL
jgi:alanine dehydrogenase